MKAFGDIAPLNVQVIRNFTGVDNRSLFNIDDTKSYLQNNMTADYFPLMNTMNKYEDHCIHWGKWVMQNRIK